MHIYVSFWSIDRSIARRFGGGRYLLEERAAEAPAASTGAAAAAAPPAPVIQNSLADHEMIGA
jgi:hypothetical protein